MSKVCKKCAGIEFYKNGKCKSCNKIVNARYYAENKEKEKIRLAEYRAKNRSKLTANNKHWRAANPEKVKVNKAKYRANHSEKCKADNAKWRAGNREKKKALDAAYRATHPEVAEKRKQWKKENPELISMYNRNRKAKKRTSGKLSVDLVNKLFILQKGVCACGCQQPLSNNYHLDHRMPIALGGSNTDDNMQLLTKRCNLKKGAKHPVDFMQSRGFLI